MWLVHLCAKKSPNYFCDIARVANRSSKADVVSDVIARSWRRRVFFVDRSTSGSYLGDAVRGVRDCRRWLKGKLSLEPPQIALSMVFTLGMSAL